MQTHATKKFYLQQASNIHFQKTCFEINQFLLCVNKDEHAWVFFFFFFFVLVWERRQAIVVISQNVKMMTLNPIPKQSLFPPIPLNLKPRFVGS